jgi:hypothetical protein
MRRSAIELRRYRRLDGRIRRRRVAVTVDDTPQAPRHVLEEELEFVGKVVAGIWIWIHLATSRLVWRD